METWVVSRVAHAADIRLRARLPARRVGPAALERHAVRKGPNAKGPGARGRLRHACVFWSLWSLGLLLPWSFAAAQNATVIVGGRRRGRPTTRRRSSSRRRRGQGQRPGPGQIHRDQERRRFHVHDGPRALRQALAAEARMAPRAGSSSLGTAPSMARRPSSTCADPMSRPATSRVAQALQASPGGDRHHVVERAVPRATSPRRAV